MSNFIKKSVFFGGLSAIIIAAFLGGIYLGYNERPEARKILGIINKETPPNIASVDFSPFWESWNLLEAKYIFKDDVKRQEMEWGAIKGMVASLGDPYTVFFPPKEAEDFESSVRGDFEGVGMEIGMRDGVLTVISPLKNSPAERAGIKSGDKILKIDEKITAEISVDEAVGLIRGQKGTKVKLTIVREGADNPIEFEIVREVVEIPVLDTQEKDGVFIISLYNFSARSGSAFRDALRKFVLSDDSKLILDLRGNPGGYLESAVDIASWFLPMGKVVAREQFSTGSEEIYRSKGNNIFNNNLKMVILIDGGTASASEILAGALKEYGLATLVGEKSFGKGTVQQLFDVGGTKASLKITIAQWLTPEGRSITKEGLMPDIEVKLTPEDKTDKQMEKALEIINNL